MNRGWPKRLPRLLAVGLVLVIAASSLLYAQSADEVDPSPNDQPAAEAEQQQSAKPQSAEAKTENAEQPPAREHVQSGLIGSKHDFSAVAGDLCSPCHPPHLGVTPQPRLDRRVRVVRPLRPFQDIDVELSGWSLLCLGCHDGTTAPDIYTSAHATRLADQLANSRLGMTGLRSHPVGVKYPPPSNEDYHPLAAVEAAGLVLPDGFIQCTTCHDPHNTDRHAGMLQSSNERSRLCLTCHRM
jgi:predicted CXXCH cytochrome family protein